MTGLFHKVGFLLYCFLTTAVPLKVLPPENVHLGWKNGLYQELSWSPPKQSGKHCSYQINSTKKYEGQEGTSFVNIEHSLYWHDEKVLNGGFLNMSIQTVCNGTMSDPVFVTLNDPDLQLWCIILSSNLTRCYWKPPSSADIRFFYNSDGDDNNVSVPLQECPLYTNNIRTGCDLPVDPEEPLNVLLNGTANNRTIRNIHHFEFLKLKLAPLNWTVKESKKEFHISWTPPEFPNYRWKYYINYTACSYTKDLEIVTGLSAVLPRSPECSYDISMRAVVEYNGGTEWTRNKHYDAISGRDYILFAVILIPLLMAVLVILSLVWCMKNRENIFPKVPQPNPELFNDILNNNNKISISNFYMTKVEEECHLTVMVDYKLIKPEL
ncbi:uncharacterized protein [Eucyclogobius newberryi]|uniref:uncharacterized protein n=1 Tax=Eucyclogobius newberryi TaxID=166745 RepID=UPI003B5BA54A